MDPAAKNYDLERIRPGDFADKLDVGPAGRERGDVTIVVFGEIAIEAIGDLFRGGEAYNGEPVGRVAGNLFDLTADDDDLILEATVGTDGVVIVGLVEIERTIPLWISGLGNLFVDDFESGFEIRGGGQNEETKDNLQLTHSSFGFGFSLNR
jgi:hypothetical protein